MPIRMTDDAPDDQDSGDSGGGGSSGGGSSGGGGGVGGGSWIIDLLFFAFRYPKIALVLAVIGVVAWFAVGRGPKGGASPTPSVATPTTGARGGHALGATLDPKVYAQALVHEPLAERTLPSRVSLLEFAPPRLSQGHQGSCVGWATSYAARTILYAKQTGTPPDRAAFSPAFTYNQVANPGCNGTYLKRALDLLEHTGDLPLSDFAYDEHSCSARPSSDQKHRAGEYRIAGYQRLSLDAGDFRTNALAVKQHLAQGAPVVIGMDVGGTFEEMDGQRVWHPTRADHDRRGDWGGHAMAVIGYDDTVEGGAFQLMNSWGTHWGENGVAFVRYRDFDEFVKEAYGLYPMGSAKTADPDQHIQFGLVETGTQRHIALQPVSGITFRTRTPIKKGTRFKVEFSNSRPVYTYLFGQESDGTSYVLFPYTDQHSPYCGTTGTRIFPRKQSLTADDVGTRDAVAVVISAKELDYKALNAKITAATGTSYADKLQSALGERARDRARVAGDLVALDATGPDADKTHALVLEFDKQ